MFVMGLFSVLTPDRLLACGAGEVEVARERGVVEVLEDRVLVVDLEHH